MSTAENTRLMNLDPSTAAFLFVLLNPITQTPAPRAAIALANAILRHNLRRQAPAMA